MIRFDVNVENADTEKGSSTTNIFHNIQYHTGLG